jgi:hypothetical protein
MRSSSLVVLALAALLVAPNCRPQQPAGPPQSASGPSAQSAPAANQTITIPTGTRIALKLVSQITSKSRSGDTVRAITAFPVSVGTQTAIPVGTYVEGTIQKLNKRARDVQIQFTRLVYANGYTVTMNGENLEAKNANGGPNAPTNAQSIMPASRSPLSSGFAAPLAYPSPSPYLDNVDFELSDDFASPDPAPAQFPSPTPTPTPTPQLPSPPHSHIALAAGLSLGVGTAITVAALVFHNHNGNYNGVLFDENWQFEMVLQAPVTVDEANVAAALALPAAQ